MDDPGENFNKWIEIHQVELAATNGDFTKRDQLGKLPITEVYLLATINRKNQGGLNGVNWQKY